MAVGGTMDKQEIVRLTVEACKEYDQKQRQKNNKQIQEWKLRNTRLLLTHYNYFRDHIDEAIYSSDQLKTIDIVTEINNCRGSIDIQSIKKSAQKTFVFMAHIDEMLSLYEVWCDKIGETEPRKLRVLKMFYLDNLKIPEIMGREFISEKTVYRDIEDAVDRLSTLIFGIEAINKMTET